MQCVQESFEYMPGWMMGSAALNAKVQYPEERIFVFNLTLHTFDWWRSNTSFSDTMDEDEVVIKDLADISHLLEFVYENTESLREKEDLAAAFAAFFEKPSATPPPKKRKKDEPVYPKIKTLNLAHIEKKLKEASKHMVFNPMNFIKIEEMPHPKAKVFYKDLSKKVAEECPPPKHSWGMDEEMEMLMAEKMKVYYEYCMEKKTAATQKNYDKASKVWGKGWKYEHNPEYEGIMIKSPPYPYQQWEKYFPHDSMDY